MRFSKPVVEFALDRLFAPLTREALTATVAGELGSVDILDGFVERPGRPAAYARGARNVTIVSSDTTIGVALHPALFALCAKAAVTVKDRDDDFVAAVAATLAQIQPELATSFRAERWDGPDDPQAVRSLAEADVVMAFGGDEALATIRSQCGPQTRFLAFGHRTSAGYVPREVVADEAALRRCVLGIARDALLYDGTGCLSLHAVFVERPMAGSEPVDLTGFVQVLAAAFEQTAHDFPAADPSIPSRLAGYRDGARFRATQGQGATEPGAEHPYLIVLEPAAGEAPPFLPRTLTLSLVDNPGEALRFFQRHGIRLEAFGLPEGPSRPDVVSAAIASGASRLATLGALQSPPLAGEHGGTPRITPYIEWMYRDT